MIRPFLKSTLLLLGLALSTDSLAIRTYETTLVPCTHAFVVVRNISNEPQAVRIEMKITGSITTLADHASTGMVCAGQFCERPAKISGVNQYLTLSPGQSVQVAVTHSWGTAIPDAGLGLKIQVNNDTGAVSASSLSQWYGGGVNLVDQQILNGGRPF